MTPEPDREELLRLYAEAGGRISGAWNSDACSAQDLPPIDLADNEMVFLGKAAIDPLLTRLKAAEDRIRELEEALRRIGDGSAFRQQRFAEDDDADYFLRCQRTVAADARAALTKGTGE